jgi:tRNA-splicing endonuclease subunit Sen54
VAQPRGPHFEKLGRAKGGITWLLPEEMLYLLERGNLDVRWGEEMGGGVGVPMSLQGAYAVVVGEGLGRVSRERWCVYAGLRRAGYIILRSPEWDGVEGEARNTAEGMTSNATGAVGLFAQLFTAIFGSRRLEEPLPLGPLVKPGCYKSYSGSIQIYMSQFIPLTAVDDIYRRLALIPTHSPHSTAKTPPSSQATSPPFCICFHIYKPSPTFRKSAPGLPDFRIAVVDAHTTITPTLAELSALLESTPFAPPPERMSKQNFQKLRHGYRNVVLAVVDQGVLSYLRMSEAAFGEVKMYERFGSGLRGGKGGRGRGGGRGNGRGKR